MKMQTKTLFIVIFFAVQCIQRSFENLVIINCKDEVDCLETIYHEKLYEGLVVILVTKEYDTENPENIEFIRYFQKKSQNFRMLKVNVIRGKNKKLASYLDTGAVTETSISFPFVAMMKNDRLLQSKSYGCYEKNIEKMLEEADSDRHMNYPIFSVNFLKAFENNDMKIRVIDENVLKWILETGSGGNASSVSQSQQGNVYRSTPQPSASSTSVASNVTGERGGQKVVLRTPIGSSTLPNNGPRAQPAYSIMYAGAYVPGKRRGRQKSAVNTSSGLTTSPGSRSPSTKPVDSSMSAVAHSMSEKTSTREVLPMQSHLDSGDWINEYYNKDSNPPVANPASTHNTSKRKPSPVAEEILGIDNKKRYL